MNGRRTLSAGLVLRGLTLAMLAAAVPLSAAAAQEEADDGSMQVHMNLEDVVRCTSVYKAIFDLSAEGSEARNLAGARAMQWGTAAIGVFPTIPDSPTAREIEALIAQQDQVVAGEVERARADAQANGTETSLFVDDFARCDALMRANETLFATINRALQAQYAAQGDG